MDTRIPPSTRGTQCEGEINPRPSSLGNSEMEPGPPLHGRPLQPWLRNSRRSADGRATSSRLATKLHWQSLERGSPWVKRGCCEGVRGQPRSCANVSAPGTALATRHSLRLATELNATQLNSARMAPFPRQTVRIAVAGKPYKKEGGRTPTHGRLRFHFFFFLVLSSHSFFNWNFICPVCLHIITIRGTFVACYANLRPAHPEMNECE